MASEITTAAEIDLKRETWTIKVRLIRICEVPTPANPHEPDFIGDDLDGRLGINILMGTSKLKKDFRNGHIKIEKRFSLQQVFGTIGLPPLQQVSQSERNLQGVHQSKKSRKYEARKDALRIAKEKKKAEEATMKMAEAIERQAAEEEFQ